MAPSVEKRRSGSAYESPLERALALAALASLAIAALGGAASAAGGDWRVRTYFALAMGVFDLIFSAEFAIAAAFAMSSPRGGPRPTGALAGRLLLSGVSSILPLAFVSAPLLIGWATGDFQAAAVRGLSSVQGSSAALAAFASFRLLRATRALASPSARSGEARGGKRPWRLGVAFLLLFVVSSLGDGLVLPSYARAEFERRRSAAALIAESGTLPDPRLVDALALRRPGQERSVVGPTYYPADGAYLADSDVELWFSLKGYHKARGLSEALAATIALLLAWASAAWIRGERSDGRGDGDARGAIADRPAGRAEIAGILGKKLP